MKWRWRVCRCCRVAHCQIDPSTPTATGGSGVVSRRVGRLVAVNGGDLQCRVVVEVRKQTRQPSGQQALADTRRPHKSRMVTSRCRDLEGQAPDAMAAHIGRFRRELGGAGIDYCLLRTSEPLEHALLAYLATRARTG